LVGRRTWAKARTPATECITLYCTWCRSALTTGPHGQVLMHITVLINILREIMQFCNKHTAVLHALNASFNVFYRYPMFWQHIFVDSVFFCNCLVCTQPVPSL